MSMSDRDDRTVIDQLYELVEARSNYDQFVEFLEGRVDRLNPRSNPVRRPLLDHLDRAARLMDVVSPWKLAGNPVLDA